MLQLKLQTKLFEKLLSLSFEKGTRPKIEDKYKY